MMTIQQAFDLAVQHHQAGRLVEAEALYRQILAVQPKHVEASHRLGVLACQAGRYDIGVELLRQAVALDPANPSAHANLGLALLSQNRFDEAIAACQRAVRLDPKYTEAYFNLGNAFKGRGQTDEAIAAYRQALRLQPHYTPALNNLGLALASQGLLDEAIEAYRRVLQSQPNDPAACNNLGNAMRCRGRLDEALSVLRAALKFNPDLAEIQNNLGITLTELGLLDDAVSACRRALELDPNHPEIHNNLGTALGRQGHLDEALDAYQRALQLQPRHPGIHGNIGKMLREQGQAAAAIAAYRKALELDPENAEMHSNLIYALHFHPQDDVRAAFEEQQRWNQQFSVPARRFIRPYLNDRNLERRLRIGYVSPDFREHVVGWNLHPLIARHDHRDYEILCYSEVLRRDKLTDEFRLLADGWRDTAGLADEAFAEIIRQDGVDILVDLTQHMAGNRLTMFAHKPAPVQVSFAGYPESTGVEAIEYRISDRWMESELGDGRWEIGWKRESELRTPISELRSERVFLIDSFWCYDPCGREVQVNELPANESGCVTFGCLNNFCKVNEPLLRLCARLLRELAEARLVMLCGAGSHRERTLELLEQEGIGSQRVEFVEPRPRGEYLRLYHRLDMAVDSFPYNGHTTSLDALWMGVPVVSLAGGEPVSRAGLSQLSNLGLPELVAHSEDEYLEIATRLARDRPRLAELRRTLRARMEASVLMDATRFARNVEAAYRAMWQRWCAETPR